MAQGLESARKTSWAGVCLGVVVSCHAAYRQFKLPPILPDLLREHPHHPAIAAGFRSVYALIGLLVPNRSAAGWKSWALQSALSSDPPSPRDLPLV